jgi:hypothetical protein
MSSWRRRVNVAAASVSNRGYSGLKYALHAGSHASRGDQWSREVSDGTPTIANLALLCRRHDRAVHEEGYQVDRQPDGELHFRRPDGRLLPEVPPPAAVPNDPGDILRARHEAQGLRIHARTASPGWLGEPGRGLGDRRHAPLGGVDAMAQTGGSP